MQIEENFDGGASADKVVSGKPIHQPAPPAERPFAVALESVAPAVSARPWFGARL